MIGHEVDIALVEGPIRDENLIAEPWQTDIMELIVGSHHPIAASKRPIDGAALAPETLIVREPGSGSREIVTRALADHGIEPRRTLEIGSTEAIKQAVAVGLGVSIVSRSAVSDQVAQGRLKIISIHGVTIERRLWQLKIPVRLDAPAAVVFEQILNEVPRRLSVAGTSS
jgi:DNA-binding transcriptional LysR family regulator